MMSNLAEQRQDPPSISEYHYALIGKMEEVETDLKATATAQDTWADLKHDLGKLVIPAEVSRAFSKIGLWLNSHHGATVTELETLQDAERDLLY
jgi:hypothetical protein